MRDHTEDKRGEPRTEVALWVEERVQTALYFQRATNLSLGGVFLEGTLPHEAGTRVTLEMELPDGMLRAEGEVVMHRPGQPGMGVRFVGLTDDARDRIRRVVAPH
jgi:uncharacterized protein (TIGR02266 family)